MRMKYIVFLSIFLLLSVFSILSFSALNTGSGSGSMNSPSMVFKEWRVGRGVRGYTLSVPIHKTFITSTQTSCWVSASVGYNGNQPQNTAPINPDTVSWSFSANHGMELDDDSISTSWSGSHPSKLSGYTSFNVVAMLNVPRHDDTTQYPNPNTIPAICTDARNDDRHDRTPRHRGGTRMAITIKFTAQTTQGNTVTKSLPLNQDETDQIRQEYLDLARQIPGRGSFDPEDFYDFGHYDQMINENLQDKHDAWVTAINERERPNLPDLTRDQLVVTSGYRNPHHNVYHARADAVHGLHQYGLALDVRGMNIDGIAGNDQAKMRLAALNADPAASESYLYSTGHVHADWRGSPWPPANPIPAAPTFRLPAQSTDPPTAITTTPSTTFAPASGHSHTVTAGTVHQAQVTSTAPIYGAYLYVNGTRINWFGGSMAKTTTSLSLSYTLPSDASGSYTIMARVYPWAGDTYGNYTDYSYTVDAGSTPSIPSPPSTPTPPSYHACGIHETSVSGDHSWITPSCGVSAHAGYACQISSDHKFPVTCPHNSDGQSCIYSTYYSCSPHTHAYPSAPREPRTPTSLSAALGSTSGSIDLSWSAPADGGSPITEYQITYCKYDNGWKRYNWTSWSSTGSTSTSYTVTGLEIGGFYRFRVRAVNSIGSSRVSRVAQKIVQ